MILEDLLEGYKVGDSYSVRIPIYVDVSKKTTKALNLNIYRNLHHHHLNTQKKNFADEVKPLLRGKPRAQKVWIHYTIFAARNGRLDTMNVGSIADKYFSDTLVEAGMIEDDNYQHIILSTFSFGGVRPMDGHAIANVNILQEESEPMRIMLDEDEVQTALETFVATLGIGGVSGVELSADAEGVVTAEILIGEIKPKNKGGRPKGSTNKTTPKAKEKADVAETGDDDSEGSSDDSDTGGSPEPETEAEKPADKPAKTADTPASKNLFGDSDKEESSDSQTESEDKAPEKDGPKVKTSKSSIFDV